MQIKQLLLSRLRGFKSQQRHWNGAQQQLYIALEGKRNLWTVRCCPKCLEEVRGAELLHSCHELIIEVRIKEPKKVPGGYVSPWQ